MKTSIESSSLRFEEGAEPGRRLREPVDLFLELHDLVAGLAQGLREAFVLGRDGRERTLRVGEAQLEAARVSGSVSQSTAQVGDLRLEETHLVHQLIGAAAPIA